MTTAPAPRGRPRAFDADAALDRAVEVFWRRGYEGASLSALTEAMGINRPSLYAAFGDKESLFQQAVRRYAEVDMAYARRALEQPNAYAVVEHFLHDNVDALTRPDRPTGCLSVQGGLATGSDGGRVATFLAQSRLAGEQALAERLERSIAEEDLPGDTDPVAMARFVMALSEGHAVHAAAGVTREELHASVDVALRAIPRRLDTAAPDTLGRTTEEAGQAASESATE